MNDIINNYLKSPFNYIGGKHKLLPQILPYFPNEINKFVDLFVGGCNVSLNVNAQEAHCNDINKYVIEFYKHIQMTKKEIIIKHINDRIEEFQLSKFNKEGYLNLRKLYNAEKQILDLFVLSCYSFNNRIRFNNKHEFNESFGADRSDFNKNIEERLHMFIDTIHKGNFNFTSLDFFEFNTSNLTNRDFVYCDPPYLISTVAYNDGKRGFKDWSEKEEKQLLAMLHELNKNKIKFALSNVFKNKGQENKMLIEWSKNYKVNYINSDYSNAHHSKKDKSKNQTVEVLITNYEI